ncbi:MAG: AbrB/MazE/SpoVT family DNA-binding domain-containing protein [Deltaproteobacteria bacterium]|jgi:AbrB family looped-hinge helix DNA binding protein|nr:AbrB/MazE/SpoVT family DNA-binding domain-containing protein [Deltaproteobacteria bacterium]
METTLDKFGRVVIPKRVREHLGLTPGTALEIEAIGEDVVLKPVREESHIRDKEGVLVFTGSATGDLLEALKRHREERSSKIGKRVNR